MKRCKICGAEYDDDEMLTDDICLNCSNSIIQDDGLGIEADRLKRIFNRGVSTKGLNSTGIGLHWCSNTVAAMEGKLYAESEGLGNGACFHLKLPVA